MSPRRGSGHGGRSPPAGDTGERGGEASEEGHENHRWQAGRAQGQRGRLPAGAAPAVRFGPWIRARGGLHVSWWRCRGHQGKDAAPHADAGLIQAARTDCMGAAARDNRGGARSHAPRRLQRDPPQRGRAGTTVQTREQSFGAEFRGSLSATLTQRRASPRDHSVRRRGLEPPWELPR